MKSELSLSAVVTRQPAEFCAFLADLRNTERLHPLLRGVALEREEGRTRVWRCDDRIMGFPLTYFARQTVDEDGLGFVNRTEQSGLTLTNTWRFEAHARGARVTERLTFEGAAPIVWFSKKVGGDAHRAIFAAIEREFG